MTCRWSRTPPSSGAIGFFGLGRVVAVGRSSGERASHTRSNAQLRRRAAYDGVVRIFRRIAVAFVGGTVLAVGVVMVVLPGPAVVVIPAGLAILATEFPWARRLLHRVKNTAGRFLTPFRRRATTERPESPDARRLRAS
jgi:uncharacterized protein (TIGR02611 family)